MRYIQRLMKDIYKCNEIYTKTNEIYKQRQ